MKVKYDFRNGQRYISITAESNDEEEFLSHFFSSPDDIDETQTFKRYSKFSDLILSKGM